VNSSENNGLPESVWPNDSNENPILLAEAELDESWNIGLWSSLNPILIWSVCVLKYHELLENPGDILFANTKWLVFLYHAENVGLYLWIDSLPNLIIHVKLPIPGINTSLSQTFVQLNRRAFNLDLVRGDNLVNLVLWNAVVSNFWVKFTYHDDKAVLLESLLKNADHLLPCL